MAYTNIKAANEGRELSEAGRGMATSNSHQPTVSRQEDLHPLLLAEMYLQERYLFEVNQLTNRLEMAARPADGMEPPREAFRPIDKRRMRELMMELLRAGIDVGNVTRLEVVIDNALAPSFHPVLRYLGQLPEWDGRDRIGELFGQMTDDKWEAEVLHRAFLATVAQMAGRQQPYANELCPVLISRVQGWGKSKSIRRLLPRELDGFFCESFNLANEDQCLRRMASYVLISLDELDHLTDKGLALLKSLIQMSQIKVRKMYGEWMEIKPRLCSFWASTNKRYVLRDATGSRRFFPVVLKHSIDLSQPIDHQQLYAQALHELDEGGRTWFTTEENALIEAHNRPFCASLQLNHLLETRFERIDHLPDDCGEYYAKHLGLLTAADIFAELQHADAELMEGYSENRFGEMLKQMGFISIRTRKHRYYNVRLRPSDPSPDEDLLQGYAS